MRARTLSLTIALLATPVALATPLPEAVVGKPPVLIANGGFDIAEGAVPVAWTVEGNLAGVKVVNRRSDRTVGLGSLELTDAADSAIVVRSRKVVGVGGGSYTLTAKSKAKSGTPANLGLEFWSYEGKRLTDVRAATQPTTQPDDWQSLRISAVAPEGTAHVTALINATKAAEGVSVWDEVDLQLAPPPYDPQLGAGRELFLDDVRIESAYHVARVVHPATTTTRPVLRADKPWESSAYIYGSVFKVGDLYRMWYTAYADVEPNYFNGYAESKDGLNWTKPELGLVDYKGSKANNLLALQGTVAYNPDAPPERRYALLGFQGGKPNDTMGYYVSFSADGLTWTPRTEKPQLLDGDVSNISYDSVGKQYIAVIKKRMFTARTPGVYERSAFVSTSPDALTWTPPRLAVMGDYADDGYAESIGGLEAQIYGMPVVRYESTYVGFPWMLYILNYTFGTAAGAGDGPVDIQLASSRDLQRWSRPTRTRVIEPGAPGSWNAGATYTAANILVDDEKITMYYGAFNLGHGGSDMRDPGRGRNVAHTGMATWRRDGWVSLTNAALPDGLGQPGIVTTKPLKFDGATLHVNAVVHGSLKIEVLDAASGATIAESAPIAGDALDAKVTWANGKSLADAAGREVKFRFSLVGGDLYSYWVTQ